MDGRIEDSSRRTYKSALNALSMFMALCNEAVDFNPPLHTYGDAAELSTYFEEYFMDFATWLRLDKGVAHDTARQYHRTVIRQIELTFGTNPKHGREWRRLKMHWDALEKHRPSEHRARLPFTKAIISSCLQPLTTIYGAAPSATQTLLRVVWTRWLLSFFLVCRWSCLEHVKRADVKFTDTAIVINISKHKTYRYSRRIFNQKVLPLPSLHNPHPLSPSTAMANMMQHQSTGDPGAPLFVLSDGTELRYPAFLKCQRLLLTLAGHDPLLFGTHSSRDGGATLHLACPSSSGYLTSCQGFWLSLKSMRGYTKPTEASLIRGQLEMLAVERERPCIVAGT